MAVMGAGAMGSVYGAALTEAGVETVVLDVDAALVERLGRDGLRLVRDDEEATVRLDVRTDAAGLEPVDFVVFFVKAFATEAAAELIAPATSAGTVAISLQNGWGAGERLAAVYAPDRVAIGVSYQSATVRAPGLVERTATGATVIGSLVPGGEEAARQACGLFALADLEPQFSEDVAAVVWEKLVLNTAANPTAALSRLPAGELTQLPEMWALVQDIARETIGVANATGCAIDSEDSLAHIEQTLNEAAKGKGSMLQDVEAGRRTEIDVITGAVVRAAASAGLDAPLNEAIYALVRGYERSLELG
ncbi:MAG: 2-dehydropantoate 2-reductase [Actinobacteria bacterium]|nr:2-dehydropantoate 2-reductase [Actinomycetota bacterium]